MQAARAMNRYGPVPMDLTPPPLSDEERSRLCRMPSGGCVDRNKHLSFTFNGCRYVGLEGDTLASALLANSARLVHWSWLFTGTPAGLQDPNPVVAVLEGGRCTATVRMNELVLFDGLAARSVLPPSRAGSALPEEPTVSGWLRRKTVTVSRKVWNYLEAQPIATDQQHALPFPKNDLPGVMTASAVSTCIRRFAVLPGREAVVYTRNDAGYDTALALQAAGANVKVVDARALPEGPLAARATLLGIPIWPGFELVQALGVWALRGIQIRRVGADGRGYGPGKNLVCDLLAVSAGCSPMLRLPGQYGAIPLCSDDHRSLLPEAPV